MLLTFIKLPFVIKIFILLFFEWPFYTDFTVVSYPLVERYLFGAQKNRVLVLLRTHNK